MGDRSFIRFGGVAGILLALTSLAAVFTYFTAAEGGSHVVGVQIFQLLYALVGAWGLVGTVAVHQIARHHGEAWSFFAMLVGVIASVATATGALYTVAYIRVYTAVPDIVPVDPLHLATFALTGVWFLVANALLWRAGLPRLLLLVGLAVAIDLFAGFVGALAGNADLVTVASLVAGGLGGPIYWLWLGILIRRRP